MNTNYNTLEPKTQKTTTTGKSVGFWGKSELETVVEKFPGKISNDLKISLSY